MRVVQAWDGVDLQELTMLAREFEEALSVLLPCGAS